MFEIANFSTLSIFDFIRLSFGPTVTADLFLPHQHRRVQTPLSTICKISSISLTCVPIFEVQNLKLPMSSPIIVKTDLFHCPKNVSSKSERNDFFVFHTHSYYFGSE